MDLYSMAVGYSRPCSLKVLADVILIPLHVGKGHSKETPMWISSASTLFPVLMTVWPPAFAWLTSLNLL